MYDDGLKPKLFNQLFANPHIGILVVDAKRKNLLANNSLCKMFGYTQKELVGKSAEIFHVSQESYELFAQKAFDIVLSGKPIGIDYKFKKKDGSFFWGHIAGDLVKNRQEVLWTFVDITKRINALEQLELKEKQLLAINALVNLATWELDLKTGIGKVSDEFCRILNIEHTPEMALDDFMKFIHKDDRKIFLDTFKTLVDGGITQGNYLHLNVEVDGQIEIRQVYQKGMIVYGENGEPKISIGATLDVTNIKKLEAELEEQKELFKHQAYYDYLTGLPNRVLLLERLEQSIKIAKREKEKLAVLFIDLDDFKSINDSLGHDKGDRYLKKLSIHMQSRIRESDILARLGGDEFVVVLNGINDEKDIIPIIENGMHIIDEPIKIDEEVIYPHMSVGAAIYPTDGEDGKTLIKNADAAMYKAKRSGKHTYRFYDKSMTKKAYERMNMERALRDAMSNDELVVYYQPQINARKNSLIGMEALVRWEHPTKGLLAPGEFLPIAHEIGIIKELNKHIIDKAVEQYAKWKQNGKEMGTLSLNMVAEQLECPYCYENLKAILEKHNCKAQWIELEVVESELINKPQQAIELLQQLQGLGIKISIDDFGTGYSSLSYLKDLPINKLKIDKSFIDNIDTNKKDKAIATTIIHLAENLDLEVIAEGVENEEQMRVVLENGCDNIQGFYYSKPVPADEMEKVYHRFTNN